MSASDGGASGHRTAGTTPLLVSVVEAQNLPIKDVASKTDPFVVVEAGGVRAQTEVQRGSVNPIFDHDCTLRGVFSAGVREELRVSVWHEDVYEDVLIGRGSLDISSVLHEREELDEWLELLDERGLRAIGADVHVVVKNSKAPPLIDLCASEDVSVDDLERSITQEPSQCDEREVDEVTGRTCLHTLLANTEMTDEMLSLLLKCNPKQARVPDRHGTPPLALLCKRYGVTEAQLDVMLKCHPPAARTANRFGKLPLHYLVRNPSLTKPLLAVVMGAYPGGAEVADQAGNLPLHYLSENKGLTKDVLQACPRSRRRPRPRPRLRPKGRRDTGLPGSRPSATPAPTLSLRVGLPRRVRRRARQGVREHAEQVWAGAAARARLAMRRLLRPAPARDAARVRAVHAGARPVRQHAARLPGMGQGGADAVHGAGGGGVALGD